MTAARKARNTFLGNFLRLIRNKLYDSKLLCYLSFTKGHVQSGVSLFQFHLHIKIPATKWLLGFLFIRLNQRYDKLVEHLLNPQVHQSFFRIELDHLQKSPHHFELTSLTPRQ